MFTQGCAPVIRLADSVDSFKTQLKTHLSAKAYPNH